MTRGAQWTAGLGVAGSDPDTGALMKHPVVEWSWSPDASTRAFRAVTAGALGALALAIFGLPPVDLHGPFHYVGVMGPLCGMTRAVRFFAQGDVATALRFNPAVVLLPVIWAAITTRWTVGRVTGRWLHVSLRWRAPLVVVPVGLLIIALWIHQQANVELIGP